MTTEHQPGSPGVDEIPKDHFDTDGNPCTLDTLCRREPAWAANIIRTLRARVAELETWNANQAGQVEALERIAEREEGRAIDAAERAESAEARVKKLEASIARIHSFAGRGDGHGSLAATEACLADTFTMLRIDYDNAAKEAEADAARITDLESQLAAAKLDLERWHTSVESDRLATILEQRDEARAEVKALTRELAAAREEQGLEARVAETLGARFMALALVRLFSGTWRAEWEGELSDVRRPRPVMRAHAATLPALLRAILAVERPSDDTCPKCKGTGRWPITHPLATDICPQCHGSGKAILEVEAKGG